MIAITQKSNYLQIALFDLLSITVVLFVPTLSHIAGFPFYLFEPMRLIIIPYLLITRSKNAYFLAIALPLFSYVLAGHPTLFKMPLVAIDLILNIAFFTILSKKRLNVYATLTVSILLSKTVYYTLKAIFIYFGLLVNGLVETSFIYQIINLAILFILALIYTKFKEKN